MDERTPLPPGEHLEEQFNPLIDDFEPKKRSYIHFDSPPTPEFVRQLVIDPAQVAAHSFFPFLGFTSIERRYKRINDKLIIQEKPRDIRYASHVDSAIFEFYAENISTLYEKFLAENNLCEVVLAYRSGIGSNIDHAASLFSEVKKRRDCICIALDISGFFDNLRHKNLKEAWSHVLGVSELPKDHYRIFRRLTCYDWVSKEDLEKRLGRKIASGKSNRICSAKEFREKVRRKPTIITPHPLPHGIPQGSSLSGLLANMYLYKVDIELRDFCEKNNATYRRYSDDIVIVAPKDSDKDLILAKVVTEYTNVGLTLNDKKTEIVCFQETDGKQVAERPFQYLGFTYDGDRILIRDSSLNRYYRKMTRSIRAARLSAKKKGIPLSVVFLRRHYKTYTHKGKGRNFVRYAYRASTKLNAPEIRRQLRRHTRIFERKVSEEFGN